MRHQITQISKTEDVGIFKISIQIPFEMGWIERGEVEFNVITPSDQINVHIAKHLKNEREYAYFETTFELPINAIYYYCFSFTANRIFRYYKKDNITGIKNVTKEECWKMSIQSDVPYEVQVDSNRYWDNKMHM